MHISSFHIDGFGILSEVGIEELPQGLSIFLGKNEAGKSTCLDFFRTMLTGYPAPRSKKNNERSYLPLGAASLAGGFLGLETTKHGLVRLTRRPQKGKDDVVLTDAQGQILDPALLDSILSGITREVYRNVFGFSLSELQVFDSLDSEGVRHALYGASFGMGLRPPSKVLEELDSYMDKQFKNKGTNPTLNIALRNLELIQKQIQEAQSTCARFDTLTLEKEKLESALVEIRTQKTDMEGQRHAAERQLGVWRQWDEWRSVEARLARMDVIPDTFPEDGPARLKRAQELAQEAIRRVNTQQERCQKLEQSIAALEIKPDLLDQFTLLQSLSERKTSFRQAQSALPPKNAALGRSEAALEQYLADLGPDWTCERIRKTDRSLFARGEMENQATDLQAAEQSHLAAMHALEKANSAVEHANYEYTLAKSNLEHLPYPTAVLDDTERENVRRSIARIEGSQNTLAEKQNAFQLALHAFQRTLSALQIRTPASDNHSETMNKLSKLLEQQDQALSFAEASEKAHQLTRDAEQSVEQAIEAEEMARARLERARTQSRENSTNSKTDLDARAKAIRGLRTLYNNFCAEKERLAELTERVNTSIAPAPVKSVALMVIGFIILSLGLAGIFIPMYWNIAEIQITPRLIIPLSQWSSYLVVLAGAAFLAGGLPRSGPETKRFEVEQKELEARANSMRLRLVDMEGHIQEQCVIAQVQAADNVTLDAVELLLEREREQYAANERLSVEINGLDAEFNTMHERLKQKRDVLNQVQNEEQQARHRWHNHLRAHDVEAIPAPEAATTFFARVEAAILAHSSLQSLREEIAQLDKQIEEDSSFLAQVKPMAHILAKSAQVKDIEIEQEADSPDGVETQEVNNEPTPPSLQDILLASVQVLDTCREADEMQSERLKAESLVHNASYNRDQANKTQAEAIQGLNESEQSLERARTAWIERLQELSMDTNVTPAMLRTALDSMERCLAVELEIASTKEEIQRLEHECAALVSPLKNILQVVQMAEPNSSNHDIPFQEDWLNCLDNLLAKAQVTYDNTRLEDQYKAQLSTQEEELHEASTALSDAKATEDNLLHLAKTQNIEEFLRLASLRTQRHELLQRQADLEDALRFAAAENDFDEFLQSFAKTDQNERELFIAKMQNDIDNLTNDDQEKSTSLAAISAELNTLTGTDDLSKLRQQESDLLENINQSAAKWASFALARQLLLQAKQRFESERQPQVIRMASEIFSHITGGRWQGITAKLDENSLQVFPPHGAPTSPLNLSRGTQEQLYLALRLAYIRNHAEHASALPVIMDDILVNFDPERARHTAKSLLSLSQGSRAHQILFFTCHPHIADMLQDINPNSQRFMVEGGQINKA